MGQLNGPPVTLTLIVCFQLHCVKERKFVYILMKRFIKSKIYGTEVKLKIMFLISLSAYLNSGCDVTHSSC